MCLLILSLLTQTEADCAILVTPQALALNSFIGVVSLTKYNFPKHLLKLLFILVLLDIFKNFKKKNLFINFIKKLNFQNLNFFISWKKNMF